MCPTCKIKTKVIKFGFYTRKSDSKRIRRFRCRSCEKCFSNQTKRIDFRYRKRHLDQIVFQLLSEGVSQRACSRILRVKQTTIARRVKRYGQVCKQNLEIYRRTRTELTKVMVDELETIEHTKCKPLTVPIAVEEKTRKILALDVGRIAAKGRLAKLSRRKYGKRRCERAKVLKKVFLEIKQCKTKKLVLKTDESPHYPKKIKSFFPKATHITYKGRRGCVVGQGELKAGGFDPLFSLNHTYAMFRDHLKCLTRRTWCTTKRPKCLLDRLYIYAWYHNLRLEEKKHVVLRTNSTTI